MNESKRCPTCCIEKSLADFYSGYRECKPCHGRYAKRKREAARERKAAELECLIARELSSGRVCAKCGVSKSLDSFAANKARRLGRVTICLQCEKPRKNADRVRYVERHGADEVLAAARDRMKAMRDRSPDEMRAYRIAWRKKQRQELGYYYLVKLLTEQSEYLKPGDIPPALLEVKRAHLLLLRAINERKEVQSEERN